MTELSLDFETFSEVDLTKVGTSRYARHESTEVLMAAYAFDRGPVKQWVPAEGEEMPDDIFEALTDPEVIKWAWNAPFEMQITEHVLGIPVEIEQWRDTMVWAMACSLPGKLEKAGPIIGLSDDMQKDKRGKVLMRRFSFPRKPSKHNPSTRNNWSDFPEEWGYYKAYNRSDVVAERNVRFRLKPYPMLEEEWETWFLDQRINRAGLPINRRMVANAIRIYEEALGSFAPDNMSGAFGQMAEITGLKNPNSNGQLLPWLQEHGYMFDDLKKGHVKRARDYFDNPPDHWSEENWLEYRSRNDLKVVLDLRLATSRTSIKKYYALDRATDDDGYLRNTLQMNGAQRTARWAGRIYQPQNLARPEKRFENIQGLIAEDIEKLDLDEIRMVYGDPFDLLASGLRPSAQAPDGYLLVDADLSAIENRVLGWLAGCDKILNVFRKNQDPYISFATYLYGQPYDVLWHEYKVLGQGAKRTISKPGTLGCGYGMGAGDSYVNHKTGEVEASGLLGYAWNMGVRQFTKEDSQKSVDTFRREFSEVKDYWYEIERAARRCVNLEKPTSCGVVRFEMQRPFLRMILPSGRSLWYLRPRLEYVDTPWGDKRLQITYEGQNDRKQWVRIHTTPGKLTENADQAISRDLLVHGMKLAARRGLDLRLHVHDQLVAMEIAEKASNALDVLKECMEEQPKWAPGLPLGSAGLVTKHFVKD
jgi:DNA polymerase